MGGRDHSETCPACEVQRGGLNDLRCDCDDGPALPKIRRRINAHDLNDVTSHPEEQYDGSPAPVLRNEVLWARYCQANRVLRAIEGQIFDALEFDVPYSEREKEIICEASKMIHRDGQFESERFDALCVEMMALAKED